VRAAGWWLVKLVSYRRIGSTRWKKVVYIQETVAAGRYRKPSFHLSPKHRADVSFEMST
jgi:hypothetical protein